MHFGQFGIHDGEWVTTDDVVTAFLLKNPMFGNPKFGRIYSPICGRLIHHNDGTQFGRSDGSVEDHSNFFFIVEVPKGEYIPPTLETTFGRFCDAVWDHKEFATQKPRDGSFEPLTEDRLMQVLKTLRSMPPVVIPKSTGRYQERIDWLNLHHPHGIGRGNR